MAAPSVGLSGAESDGPPPEGLTPREHAHLARALIDACGGVDEILRQEPSISRVGRSPLYDYAAGRRFMPMDVVSDLEAYAGEPVYSRVMAERRPYRLETASPGEEACSLSEHAAALQHAVRLAAADHVYTPRELAELEVAVAGIEVLGARLRTALTRAAAQQGAAS